MSCDRDTILKNIASVKKRIADAEKKANRAAGEVKLLCATKTVCAEDINFALDNGISLIGENRVQELLSKYDAINRDKCEIHFIGALQTNKVKYIIDKVSMIHSVDSYKLCEEISKRALSKNKVMDILIEVNIACEESKSGVMPEEVLPLVEQCALLSGVRIRGLMAVPPERNKLEYLLNNPNNSEIGKNIYNFHEYFQKIQQLIIDISRKKLDNVYMEILSLGMSQDFEEAIAHGSTLVRLGSAVFGERDYSKAK